MLNSIDSNKHGLKMKFGAIPAMLSLLCENPCTLILCLCLYFFEQRELSHADFKKLLGCINTSPPFFIFLFEISIDILCPDRAIPLHPHMLLDYLENEIGIDARVVSWLRSLSNESWLRIATHKSSNHICRELSRWRRCVRRGVVLTIPQRRWRRLHVNKRRGLRRYIIVLELFQY